MGSELMGQLIMGQLSDGVVTLPSWVDQCPNKSEWFTIPRDQTSTKECSE